MTARPVAALDFAWSATADTLDWFGIDNPDVGNSGWTLLPNFITTQAPDGPEDRAFINLAGKTVTLSRANTVGAVTLGAQQLNVRLRLITSTTNLTVVDAFSIGPGGQLEFQRGTVNVTSGVLHNAGLIHGISNIAVINANVVNADTGVVQVDNGATLQFNSPGTTFTNQAIMRTIAGGTLTIAGGVTLINDGGSIDNQGTLSVGSGTFDFVSGSTTGNPLTLSGTTLNLSPAIGAASFAFNGGIFNGNIASGQTVIQQSGAQALIAPDSFSNAGVFQLEGPISAPTVLTVLGGGVVKNTGTFRAVATPPFGVNRRVNGTINNQADLVLDPSVHLVTNGLVNTGTTSVGGGATLRMTDVGSSSGTMTFGPGSLLTIDNNGTFTHAGGSTSLEGEWEFGSGATFNYTGGSVAGSGQMQFNDATLNLSPGRGPMTFQFDGGTFNGDLDAGQTLRHRVSFPHLHSPDSFVNAGLLELAGTNQNETRLNVMGGGVLTNTGTIHAIAEVPNGIRRRIAGTIDNQNTLTVDPSVEFRTNGLINTGNINMGAGSTLIVTGGVFSQNGGTINNAGATINDSTVNFNGGQILGAPVVVAGNSSLNFGPNADGTASFTHTGSTISGTIGPNTTVNLRADTVFTRTVTANASLTNKGHLHFDDSPGGAIHLQVDGLELVNEVGATISGNGTITFSVPAARFVNRGISSIGSSAGQFDIDGDFENASTGTMHVEIGGQNATDYDVTIVSGHAELGGLLEVSLIGGFTPSDTDVFTIIAANSLAGMFNNADNGERLATAGNEGSLLVTYDAVANTVLLSSFVPNVVVGDYNSNGTVDAADYVVWRKANVNGQQGYDAWRANFGRTAASASAAAAMSFAAVPEPAAVILIGTTLLCMSVQRHRWTWQCEG